MLLDELLTEAATAPLYHGTSWENAQEILKDGGFMGLSGHRINNRLVRGISATRSPRVSHIDYDPQNKSGTQVRAFNVVFVFDQDTLRQRFQVHPVDYFRGEEAFKSLWNKQRDTFRDRRAESEEFIEIPQPGHGNRGLLPLKGNVSKILYFPDSFSDPEDEPSTDDFLAFRQRAVTFSIPVVSRRVDYNYMDRKREFWTARDRASMITHADKNEFDFTQPFGQRQLGELMPLLAKYREAGQPKDDATFQSLFNREEQAKMWVHWLLLNSRKPKVPDQPMNAATGRALFNVLARMDPKQPIAYHKIIPFRPLNPPKSKQHARS
jgi:hypothetical protein